MTRLTMAGAGAGDDNRSHRDAGKTEEINGRSLGCGFIFLVLFLIRFYYLLTRLD